MGRLTDWGLDEKFWQGQRGEYWVIGQAFLILIYLWLPVYRPAGLTLLPPALYVDWTIAALLGLSAVILVGKGLLDLGQSLTPLPYPRADGQLVQTGVYGLVRHPLYGGLTLAALAWAIYQVSLSHFAMAIILFVFLSAKATREETWLKDKYPEYIAYQQRVKKLIPWIY